MTIANLKTPILQFTENAFLNEKQQVHNIENVLLDSALHYASLGCPVFPVHSMIIENDFVRCSCRKWRECTAQGKHPRTQQGLTEASSNSDKIREWWRIYPNANVGLITGRRAGFFVLDVDTKYGGNYSLLDLEDYYRMELGENYEPFPATLTAITGSGGRHYFFKYPQDILVNGSVSNIGEGLDIRGEQNYVVASPSNHLSGNNYSWLGINTPLLNAPDWLIYEIISKESGKETISVGLSTAKNSKKIIEGSRHKILWRYICGLVNSHSKEETLKIALEKNKEDFEPPLPNKEVIYQVDYLFNRYAKIKNSNMSLR